jgi:predicted ATPase with chaperone activity
MTSNNRRTSRESVLAAILSQENFWPAEPQSLRDTGLPVSFIEALICKRLAVVGLSTGRQLAKTLCLPFQLLADMFQTLRERQIIVHKGSAPLNDYTYSLTEKGRERARAETQACSYIGPAPIPLVDYVVSVEAQTIRAESPKRKQLEHAFKDISVNRDIFETLGPAVNSGAGLFLYGEPGNGKTTLAKRVIRCFGQQVWVPHAIIDDGQIIKLYDPSLHESAPDEDGSLVSKSTFDSRWVRIRRPTVVVGGELTLDSLEIRHDPATNVSEAPLQMKSNCGCFLIDDFGRQRVEPKELLNRWIVPLEGRIDYLTLSTGKKIQIPFEQLIVFSTNLDPSDLVDEAFLRRIPYKIFVRDPDRKEFHALFRYYAQSFKCEYRPEVVEELLANHYLTAGRRLRRCHPRDLLSQIRNYCVYNDIRIEMRSEYFDHVVKSYFADTVIKEHQQAKAGVAPMSTPPQRQAPPTERSQTTPARPPQPSSAPTATMQCDPSEIARVSDLAPVSNAIAN